MVKWLSIDTEGMRETTQHFFDDLRRIGETFISYSSSGGKKIYVKLTNDGFNRLSSTWYRSYPFFADELVNKPKVSDYDIIEDMSSDDVHDIDNGFKNERNMKKINKEADEIVDYRTNPLRKIARENNISEPKFLQFIARRFPNIDLEYADDWAKRIRNGTAHDYGDSKSREALKKSGL